MISTVYSALPHGYTGEFITVEGDSNRGLPSFNIVGMGNKTVSESRERIRSALTNSNFSFPDQRLTINLAPAEIKKTGSHLDLAIAIAILVLSGQLLQNDVEHRLFVGELALDGQLRPVSGIINIIEQARQHQIKEVFVPYENYHQATLVAADIKISPVQNLLQLFLYLKQQRDLVFPQNVVKKSKTVVNTSNFDYIYGQTQAKRALTIAMAGHHNILLFGPPGSGKTLLARSALDLLPPLSLPEQIEVTKIHSLLDQNFDIISDRPFRSPHHSASLPSLVGGGANSQPGEISLAHLGVLFLDELPEFSRHTLESLRQPLEDHKISLSRANSKVEYPADFILIATMNPCPCGYYGSKQHECTCSPTQIQRYHQRISGPLLDRFDLSVQVESIPTSTLIRSPTSDHHDTEIARTLVSRATAAQQQRFRSQTRFNSSLSSYQLSQLAIEPDALHVLSAAANRLKLSARAYFRVIKVAQTIADLQEAPTITADFIAEALQYRQKY